MPLSLHRLSLHPVIKLSDKFSSATVAPQWPASEPAGTQGSSVTTTTFRAVARPKNLSLEVADAIAAEITGGRYRMGDRLPSEARLAEMFAVSRGIVREAVARLKAAGLIETVQGAGAFVARTEVAPGLRIDPAMLVHGGQLQPVFELRIEIEVVAAGLAAHRRRRRDLDAMRRALAELAQIVDRPAAHADPDYTFHTAIARASGNHHLHDLLAYVTTQVKQSVGVQRRSRPPTPAVLARVHGEHTEMLRAITERDAARAEQVTRAHLLGAAERLGLDVARLGRTG